MAEDNGNGKKQNGNGNGGAGPVVTNVTGVLTSGAVAMFIIQQRVPFENKMLYLSLLAVGGFLAVLMRFQMTRQVRLETRQAEVLEALLTASIVHDEHVRNHDTASADAHREAAADRKEAALIQRESTATLKGLVQAVNNLCNNNGSRPGRGGDEE